MQDLWKVHYQILLTISLKEFTKLNVKNTIVFLNTKVSMTIQWIINVYLDRELKNRFKNISEFSNNDFCRFILLLRKGVYPYEYMNHWEKFNETSSPEKGELYSNLNTEDITHSDYSHAKRICNYL